MTDEAPQAHRFQDSLGYRLTYVARSNERRFEARIAGAGLTRLGWCVLSAAHHEGLSRPSEIADLIGVDRAAISRVLRRLEAAGAVAMAARPGDGRARHVTVTAAGRARLAEATADAAANAAAFEARMTDEERAVFTRLMDRLFAEDRGAGPLKGL